MPLSGPEIGTGKSAAAAPVAAGGGVGEFIFPDASAITARADTGTEGFSAPSIEDVLQNAREEAAQIVAQAERQSLTIEQIARENALQEVRLELEAENAAQIAALRTQLADTITQISALSEEITKRVEHEVVELALEIAKKVVAREVSIDREVAFTLVKVSLAKLHNRSVAQVHLNPEDLAFVESHREKLGFRGSLELVEDRSISMGGCLIHTETGEIDARIKSQFEEITHGLLGEV
jgi:flagellar assembly protein FliH